MVTERQVRRLMRELTRGEPLVRAAMRSGMSGNTARRYREEPGRGRRREARGYRTRPDSFAEVWPEVEGLLERAPGLSARTIFEVLHGREGCEFSEGQLRTLQRRVKGWRARRGPEKEVMFQQEHRPGEYGQSDFTSMNSLGVSIGGEAFEHLFYHFVLPYSNWETGRVCFSESFEALVSGFQAAVWELDGVPKLHRTDNLSAATHDLAGGGRDFNERYLSVMRHYGVVADRNSPGRAHENGDVEQGHYRFKVAVEQALLLRGSREFGSRGEYEGFLRQVLAGRNRPRLAKLSQELECLRQLPAVRLEEYRAQRVRVSRFSTVRIGDNNYSVPSRLIGEQVETRLYPERVEVWLASERVLETERMKGTSGAAVDYRHVIWSLVKKPGAFARYRYRDCLFPSVTFRKAYDALLERRGARADVEYVRILHLAASTSQSEVEAALSRLLEAGELSDYAQVKAAASPEPIAVPQVELSAPDLTTYDEGLRMAGGER